MCRNNVRTWLRKVEWVRFHFPDKSDIGSRWNAGYELWYTRCHASKHPIHTRQQEFDRFRFAGLPIPRAGDFLFLGILLLAPQIGDSALTSRSL